MKSVGVRELKQETSRILREVRERGESYDVTYHGKVIARIVPAEAEPECAMTIDEIFDAWDALVADDPEMPQGNYALEAIWDSRRRLG